MMLSRLYKQASLKPLYAFKRPLRSGTQTRYLATVEANTPRQVPVSKPRATPVSHDRATFTIRVRLPLQENIGDILTVVIERTCL